MHTVQTSAVDGLRARKKRQTHDALCLAARELAHERGLERVTVEEIAAAAGVSPRTFFNYFACKEEAVVGLEPNIVADLADELRARPVAESPTVALRAVLYAEADVEGMLRRWELRNQLVRAEPALLPRHLASLAELEEGLTAALAERLGVDPDADPMPGALISATFGIVRSTLAWWSEQRDPPCDLTTALDRVVTQLLPDS
jgi:AcrR family transcriptional regulator